MTDMLKLKNARRMYESTSDSGLISIRARLKADYQRARTRDDAEMMAYFEDLLKLVEDVLCERGKR